MKTMIRYDRGQGPDANWIVSEGAFDSRFLGKCEAIFAQGNGYLGQRAALEEDYVGQIRNLFVTGTFNRFADNEVTELPNLPDLTRVRILVDGRPFSMDRGRLLAYHRSLNLKTGEVVREVELETPEGKRLALEARRFVSLKDEHLLGFRLSITALAGNLDLRLESGINGQVTNTGSQHFQEGDKRLLKGRFLRMTSTTTQSGVVCALHAVHSFRLDGQPLPDAPHPVIDRRSLLIQQDARLQEGQTLVMEKLCSVHTSRDLAWHGQDISPADIEEGGLASISWAADLRYEGLFDRSRAAWARLWDNQDIEVVSDSGFDQLALRFALYHLNIMIKKDDPRVGVAAKGLTGEGYKGHSFWDTEIFILPYFTFTQPEAARSLLTYRYLTLQGARDKARENGYTGAMYPWESAWLTDGEVTPLWGAADIETGEPMKIWTGIIEQHISADIAYAVWQYYEATGDAAFMAEMGYEIILDTARFWASRATWNEEKAQFEYLGVIGPDEYKEHVDNNAFTNYMAAWNMKKALRIIRDLRQHQPDTYKRLNQLLSLDAAEPQLKKMLEGLYLPQPNQEGILPQFDGYFDLETIDLAPYKAQADVGSIYRDYNNTRLRQIQVAKQADVLVLFFLLEELFPQALKERNYHYHEARTLHDSSLSKSTHAVLASDLGLHDIAYDFFLGSARIDLGPSMRSSDMGIHAAAMGGIWQAAVYGFGGIRQTASHLRIAPHLPASWHSLRFPLVYQGQPLKIQVFQDRLRIQHLGDKPLQAEIWGQQREIAPGTVLEVEKEG